MIGWPHCFEHIVRFRITAGVHRELNCSHYLQEAQQNQEEAGVPSLLWGHTPSGLVISLTRLHLLKVPPLFNNPSSVAKIFYIFKISSFWWIIIGAVVCIHAHMYIWVQAHNVQSMPRCSCWPQRTTQWSQFYPSFLMWIPGFKFRSPGLHAKQFYPQSWLTGLRTWISTYRLLGDLIQRTAIM